MPSSRFCPPPVNSGAPASVARPGLPGRLGGIRASGSSQRFAWGFLRHPFGDWVVFCPGRRLATTWRFDTAMERSV